MLKTRNIGAYRDLLLLFTRYGRKDFRFSATPEDFLLPEPAETLPIEPDVQARANAFAAALKSMGPTYVKFGQLLSTRPDIVPQEYIVALESLQDDVEPFSFADVERTVEEELGVRISKAFESFDSTPLAAASLGQVHRAILRDGREVVVKVQRPNVREQVQKDLEVFMEIAQTLETHADIARKMSLVSSLEQVRMAMYSELNYLQEARNSETIRANLTQFPQIYIPAVVHDLSSSRVLTTELVKGKKVSKLTPLSLVEGNYAALAGVLTHAYLKQICVDGFWHSDPHPGNVFIREIEGVPEIVLLDFGMVARISHELQDEVIKLLLAISSNRGAEVADACVRMSEVQERFDPVRFTREISTIVAAVHDVTANDINTGQLLFNVIGIANNNELKAPAELALLAKTLLHLDAITKKLDPDYDPQRVIRDYAEQLISQKLAQKFHPRNFYPALLDLNQLVLDLPHRTREIVDLTAAGRLTFGIKLTQAEEFLRGIHKIANRITVGVVIAALLISSALMMRVPSRFSILGYSGLAVVGYLIAAAAAVYLMWSVLRADHKDSERAKFKGK
ncbi:MAG TPA: AarF/UbiB family protein [Thermoanaerobaculia bacterium]|jgi:predicted unusual protein kinase regulating ubiquinone biosynthesis (AarF/ABC1/UbiB family)